ncbi:MAG: hypothetical protein GWM98_04915 [Nitrospinaceae bacterium]|nr:hypothetical protein [Nitrospinaceae bacterium]NIR53914.1 hypothetical protein [Nitrospinaceae bacterium]NIS84331.1 hypothetical protein [Nitrospinaceae bacterium]NIT81135.1 hypothetical protein [Nitrospinaceae bacterium]NIU43417.1 hypothetical protein [Nitrospinaceae bacterium]
MSISPSRIGTLLILSLFVFANIQCAGKKKIDPDAPRVLKEFPAEGGSSSKDTDEEPGKITVEAQCPEDYPVLVECKKWWAETGTAGKDPFKLKGADGATQRQTQNACVCDGRHDGKAKTFFGISNHYIKCGVTAVCANK